MSGYICYCPGRPVALFRDQNVHAKPWCWWSWCLRGLFLCLLALLFPNWVEHWCEWGDWRLSSPKQPCLQTSRAPVRPVQPTGMLPLQPFSSLEMRYSRWFSVAKYLSVRLSCICVIDSIPLRILVSLWIWEHLNKPSLFSNKSVNLKV